MVGEFRSKVVKNMGGSESVRTTVPEAVAAILGAVPGSTLVWSVEPGSAKVAVAVDREVAVKVRRSKKLKSSKRA